MNHHRFAKSSKVSTHLIIVTLLAGMLPASGEIGILSPTEASALIESAAGSNQDLVVIDTRGGYKDYFRGHLPMAHHLEFDTLRGTQDGIPVQYLPPRLTVPLLKRAGVHRRRTHLLYATGSTLPNDEILSATMVAYVLEKYGIDDIMIVDGGLKSWAEEGLPVEQAYHGNPSGSLPSRRNFGIASDIGDIKAAMSDESVVIVDARPFNEYTGDDDVWFRKGHIPTAVSFPWFQLMADDNTHKFRPVDEVRPMLEEKGITTDRKIICYCGTSREGSLLRFYLRHLAGYPNVTLYEGAWKEYVWLEDQSLPTRTGPNP